MTAVALDRRCGLASAATGLSAVLAILALVRYPPIIGLALLGIGLAIPVLARPVLPLLLVAAFEVSNIGEVMELRGVGKVYLAALVLASVAMGVGLLRGTVRLAWSPVLLFAGVLLATRAISVLTARVPAIGVEWLIQTAKDFVLLLVVMTLLTATRAYKPLAKTVVGVMALLAGLALVQEFVFHNATDFFGFSRIKLVQDLGGTTLRHSGQLADPNFWARNLVLFVPMALSIALHRVGGRMQWSWFVPAALLGGGLYLSQSRGGLLALVLGVASWYLLAGGSHRRLLQIGPAVVLVALAIPGVGSRLATLSYVEDGPATVSDLSLVDRISTQRVGMSMFYDEPALGVGAANYAAAWRDYARNLGVVSHPEDPHNLYLQMAAESGVLGLTGWLLFYGSALFVTARALVLSRRLEVGCGRSFAVLLAAAVLAGLVAWGFASLFLHLAYWRTFLVVVGIGAALDIEARRTVPRLEAVPAP